MHDFSKDEWKQLTSVERKIVILAKEHNVSNHDIMRKMLTWPLPEPMKKSTYQSHWSRLRKKVAKIAKARTIEDNGN